MRMLPNYHKRIRIRVSLREVYSANPVSNLLGFQVDTVNMVVNLPHDKVEEVLNECRAWKGTYSASKKQIQSLASKLQHLAKCVKPATCFMNRVLCTLRTSPPTGQHPFSSSLLNDLDWFIQFMTDFNKVVLLPSVPPHDWVIECDRCGCSLPFLLLCHYIPTRS